MKQNPPRLPDEADRPLELQLTGSFSIEAAAGDDGQNRNRRFTMIAYTGGPMRVAGFSYPVVVDLAGLDLTRSSWPVFVGHRQDIDDLLGQTDRVEIIGSNLVASGEIIAAGDRTRRVVEAHDRGFRWQASLGAAVIQREFVPEGRSVNVNGSAVGGPVIVARRAELGEISFVFVGADRNTSATIAAANQAGQENKNMDENTNTAVVENQDETPQSDAAVAQNDKIEAKAGKDSNTPVQPDLVADMRAHAAAEQERIAAVRKVCGEKYPEIAAKAIANGWDVTRTELEVLRAERPKPPAVHVPDNTTTGSVLEAACMLTGGVRGDSVAQSYGEQAVESADKRFTAEAQRLGLVMRGDDAKAADDLHDSLQRLWLVVKMGVFQVGAALAPAIQQLVGWMTAVSVKIRIWIEANRQVVVTIAKVAVAVIAVGATLVVLGTIISGVGMAIGVLTKTIALLTSPITLVKTAVVALGATLVLAFATGTTAAEKFAAVFNWFKEAAITALSAVVFAFKNWRAVLEYVFVGAVLNLVRFASQVQHFFVEVIPATLSWFADNWKDVFRTIWRFTATVATNIGKNLKGLWDAIIGFAKGEGWNFEWTPLLEGFESAVKELPKIAERQIGPLEADLQKRVDELGAQLNEKWQAHDSEFRAALGESPAVDAVTGVEGGPMELSVDTEDLEVAMEKATVGVVGTFSGAAAERLGSAGPADRTAIATEETARNTKRLLDEFRRGGASFA